MGLRFIDSFDHYTNFLQKWTSSAEPAGGPGTILPVITAGDGRAASASVKWATANTGSTYGQKTIPGAPMSSFIVGFAWKLLVFNSTVNAPIMEVVEDTTVHLRLAFEGSTARLKVYRGATLIGTGNRVLVANTFYFIEIKGNIHDTTGSFEVRINESVDFSDSNIDTRNAGATGLINVLRIGSSTSATGAVVMTHSIDDVYITDSPTYLGDCRVEAIVPTADGNYTAWTPSSGGTHFDDVDEAAPNDDTDYITSTGIGSRDSWTYSDIAPTGATIRGIQYMPRARTDIEGARTIKPFYRVSAVDYDFATGLALTTAYEYPAGFVTEVNPSTGSAWTLAQIQAAEFGIKVEA